MENLHYHTPLNAKPKQHTFLAFDVEGIGGIGNFWCGSVFGPSGLATFTDAPTMWQYLLSPEHGSAWRCAHNLEYDLSVLNLEALLSGGAVMGASGLLWYDTENSEGKSVHFMDSLNLFRGLPLKEVGQLIGLPKLELPAGVFEALRMGFPYQGFTTNERAMIEEYNGRDAEIVYRALNFLQSMVNDLGGELRDTIGTTSHDLYRRVYMPHAWPTIGPNTNETAREAFYGGRSEPYRMGKVEGVNMYDANSLYPYIMRESQFPHPGYLDLDVPSITPTDLDRREGIANVTIEVPRQIVPPLPARVDNSLFFPCGQWQATFTLNELRHALECGATIKQWHYMISTRKLFNPFTEFVNDLWQKRSELALSNPPGSQIVKMLLNSHIGRYGIRPTPPLTTLEIVKERFDPEKDQGLIWSQIGRYDYIERPLGEDRIPTYANVFFAAQVAAGARVFLHDAMLAQKGSLIYVDTDAIMTTKKLPVGSGLGQWKNQLSRGTVDLIGPKEYAVLCEHDQYIALAKGVPQKVAAEYLKLGKARWDQALTLRQARVNNQWPGSWVEVVKHQGKPLPKRWPIPLASAEVQTVVTQSWIHSDLVRAMAEKHRPYSWEK